MIEGGVYGLHGWRTAVVDGTTISSKAELLDALAAALEFPPYFGRNWDALNDSLTDLAPAEGYLIVYAASGVLGRSDPAALATAREILANAAEWWRQRGTPFVVLDIP